MYNMSLVHLRIKPRQTCQHMHTGNPTKPLTPGSAGVDAFSLSWEGQNNWLVPPIYLVPRVILHCIACQAVGTLVVPKWPSAPFWPLIFRNSWQCYPYIADVLEFDDTADIFQLGSYKGSLLGSSRFRSKVLVVRIEP